MASLVDHCSPVEREAEAVAERCMELREQHDQLVAAEADVMATHAKVSRGSVTMTLRGQAVHILAARLEPHYTDCRHPHSCHFRRLCRRPLRCTMRLRCTRR